MIYILALVIFVLVLIAFKTMKLMVVSGMSMYPTLKHGDILLVLKTHPNTLLLYRSIIVVEVSDHLNIPAEFRHLVVSKKTHQENKTLYVKRLVGLPYETVNTEIKQLYEELNFSELFHKTFEESKIFHVPANHIYVEGDSLGTDSRVCGAIPQCCIRGYVLLNISRLMSSHT